MSTPIPPSRGWEPLKESEQSEFEAIMASIMLPTFTRREREIAIFVFHAVRAKVDRLTQENKEQADMLIGVASVAQKAEADVIAVEEAVRRVCPIPEDKEDDDSAYMCFTEDANPIIDAPTLGEAVRQIIAEWIAVGDELQQLRQQGGERT